MSFLSSIFAKVSESFNLSSQFTVAEIGRDAFTQHTIIANADQLKLYSIISGSDSSYMLVLTIPGAVPKYFRLFHLPSEQEAMQIYGLYSSRVVPIVAVCKAFTSSTSKLQELCNKVRQYQSDSVVHHCVKLGLRDAIKKHHPEIAKNVDALDDKNCTPLILACQTKDVSDDIVYELMRLGANLGVRDMHNETALHHAARCSPSKLKLLLGRPTDALDYTSVYGETALCRASSEGQVECVRLLLQYGADPNAGESYKLPLHCAIQSNHIECVKVFVEIFPQLLSTGDGKFGGTPLHWAKTREMITCLLERDAPIDTLSKTGDTPLHVMLTEDRRDCVNTLLTSGASLKIPNHLGKTPLHIAIPTDDLAMVRSLLVFGADINRVDSEGSSPRHLAATQKSKNSRAILHTLHMIGASRCAPPKKHCTSGCSYAGKGDGDKVSDIDNERLAIDEVCDELLSTSLTDIRHGYRVLCLDGGGIRGLVLAMLLIRLEEISGVSIKDSFDWISGTSTGGILALALARGRSGHYCLGLYFKLKNRVFSGGKPYKTEVLESMLKEEYGDALMSDLQHPRVIVTALLADRYPPDLHLFRSYDNPMKQHVPKESCDKYALPPEPNEVYVWQAARSSGAAPTYFTASMDKFLDGGLMSNNPTLDTLTEIHEYNTGLKLMGRHHEVKPIKCVLSLGTGRPPKTVVKNMNTYEANVMQVYKMYQGDASLVKFLVEQASQSEGRPNDRARAWCSMTDTAFFRLSPPLSLDVPLDETDDDKLLLVCWETMVYLHRCQSKLVTIANILNSGTGPMAM